jgi:hypothetical protein
MAALKMFAAMFAEIAIRRALIVESVRFGEDCEQGSHELFPRRAAATSVIVDVPCYQSLIKTCWRMATKRALDA